VNKKLEAETIVADEDDERQFLPETDQDNAEDEGEMHISPALRALMAKSVFHWPLSGNC
jgi:hypothetical protein